MSGCGRATVLGAKHKMSGAEQYRSALVIQIRRVSLAPHERATTPFHQNW